MKIRIIGAIIAILLAAAGTITVVFYVQGADQRAAQGAELVAVYVVRDAVPQGSTSAEVQQHLTVSRIARNAAQSARVTDLAEIAGKVAAVDLLPGEQLVLGRFVDPATLAQRGAIPAPDGLQEMTIALPVERVVGGAATPGSHVGIVVTVDDISATGASSATTKFAFENVLVTRVQAGNSFVPSNASSNGASSNGSSSAQNPAQASAPASLLMVTVAVSTPDVERLVWAAEQQSQQKAGIWLTLQTDGTDRSGSTAVSGSNVFQ